MKPEDHGKNKSRTSYQSRREYASKPGRSNNESPNKRPWKPTERAARRLDVRRCLAKELVVYRNYYGLTEREFIKIADLAVSTYKDLRDLKHKIGPRSRQLLKLLELPHLSDHPRLEAAIRALLDYPRYMGKLKVDGDGNLCVI